MFALVPRGPPSAPQGGCHPGLLSSAVTEELLSDPLQRLRLNFLQLVLSACRLYVYTTSDWEFYLRTHSPSENRPRDAQPSPGLVSARATAKAPVGEPSCPLEGGCPARRGHLILAGPDQLPPGMGLLLWSRFSCGGGGVGIIQGPSLCHTGRDPPRGFS